MLLSHRNPFFPKYFLSVGDWTWRVWNEDLRSPLLVSPYAAAYLSSGTWSPTRPGEHTEYVESVHRPSQLRVLHQSGKLCCLRTAGVFFTTHTSGMLSAWDLVYKHSEPTLQVSSRHQACLA